MNGTAGTVPRTMTAWCQDRYGGPEAVTEETVDTPTVGREEVVLRIRATSLNAADRHVMRGDPLLLRAAFGLRRPRAATRGMDVAATVVATGPDVTALTVGDEVMGELSGGGGLAQYAVSAAGRLVPRPAGLDPLTAATLPLAGGTAWQALELASVAAGERVLVVGASGGVGTFAVQLAALRGAEVWALCGARSQELVTGLGAKRTFDYRETDAAALPPSSFDAIVDIAGENRLRTLKALLRPGGTVVMVGGEGGRVLGPLGRMLRAVFVSLGGRGRSIRPLAAVAKPEVTRELAALAASGRIRPVIEHAFGFSEADAALARIDAGRTVGKVVVQVHMAE
ncbi:MAG: NAD(P)-dependent alcohol dehydrogenase [Microbacterium pygmaeum]